MADYAFLIGRSDATPVYSAGDRDEEIVYACDWIPIAWLAFFEPADVTGVAWPPESEPDVQDGDEWPQCCAILRSRESALVLYARRKDRLKRVFPPYMAPLFDALERAVQGASSGFIQVVLSDLDVYLSFFEEMSEHLRDDIAVMDSEDVGGWSGLMPAVQAEMLGAFGKVHFKGRLDIPAAVGYLPDEYAIDVSSR